jgi:hypothetical protein
MTFDPLAHPRTGSGQFAEKLGTDPEVSLAYSEGGNGFPAPQADRLDKVAVAVDAIAAGAETPDAVAESLGMTQSRNGHMYGDAAGYLGLVDVINENPKHYGLTPLGEQFIGMEPDQRSAMLNTLVADSDIVQTYNDRGDGGVEELLEERGYSGETVSRRAQTAASWAKHVEGAEMLDLTDEIAATRERAAEAAKKVESKRVAAAPEVCPDCFMQKSVDGSCMCF